MQLLLVLPVFQQVVVVVSLFAAIGAGGLCLVRWLISSDVLKEDHDTFGWLFGVLGAFFGAMLAFVTVACWQRFQLIDLSQQDEAFALANLYSVAHAYRDPVRASVEQGIHRYIDDVTRDDQNTAGAKAYLNDLSDVSGLWTAVVSYDPKTPREEVLFEEGVQTVMSLANARRLRHVYHDEDLPNVLWIIIYAGAFVTIAFSNFFGATHFRSQIGMCAAFAALIGLAILAITDLAHPYQGQAQISLRAFNFVSKSIASTDSHLPDPRSPARGGK